MNARSGIGNWTPVVSRPSGSSKLAVGRNLLPRFPNPVSGRARSVNDLGTYGRWAFAEFKVVYEIEADFNQWIEQLIDQL